MNKIKTLFEKLKTPRAKRVIYISVVAAVVLWFTYRFIMIGIIARTPVFNATRMAAADGVPVNTVVAARTDGVLRMPVAVRQNTAYVTHDVATALKPGMKIGDGTIASVGGGIDLDSGMYVVRTRNVADGLHFAEYRGRGYFIPTYAVRNGAVIVARDDTAHVVPVTVARVDADNALVTSGLNDGDVVVISNVSDGVKIKVSEGE